MVKATKGTLVQVDESIMAIIKTIDNEMKNQIIIQDLDSETCLINEDKLHELQLRLKEKLRDTVREPEESGSD